MIFHQFYPLCWVTFWVTFWTCWFCENRAPAHTGTSIMGVWEVKKSDIFHNFFGCPFKTQFFIVFCDFGLILGSLGEAWGPPLGTYLSLDFLSEKPVEARENRKAQKRKLSSVRATWPELRKHCIHLQRPFPRFLWQSCVHCMFLARFKINVLLCCCRILHDIC